MVLLTCWHRSCTWPCSAWQPWWRTSRWGQGGCTGTEWGILCLKNMSSVVKKWNQRQAPLRTKHPSIKKQFPLGLTACKRLCSTMRAGPATLHNLTSPAGEAMHWWQPASPSSRCGLLEVSTDTRVTEVPGPGPGKARLPTGWKNTEASPLPPSHHREEEPSKAWSPSCILLQIRNKTLDTTLVACH